MGMWLMKCLSQYYNKVSWARWLYNNNLLSHSSGSLEVQKQGRVVLLLKAVDRASGPVPASASCHQSLRVPWLAAVSSLSLCLFHHMAFCLCVSLATWLSLFLYGFVYWIRGRLWPHLYLTMSAKHLFPKPSHILRYRGWGLLNISLEGTQLKSLTPRIIGRASSHFCGLLPVVTERAVEAWGHPGIYLFDWRPWDALHTLRPLPVPPQLGSLWCPAEYAGWPLTKRSLSFRAQAPNPEQKGRDSKCLSEIIFDYISWEQKYHRCGPWI